MNVIEKKPIPIYETVCPECKSRIEYKASEVHFTGYITCPVCGTNVWAIGIKPARYEDDCETNMNIEAELVKHGRWIEDEDPTLPSHCSVCGESALEWVETRYCPWCGAKMENEE